MPFTRPNLTSLRQQARGFFAARLPGTDATLRRSNIGVTADCMAGLTHGNYGYLDYLAKQGLPDTATDSYFLRWANLFAITPLPAVVASGTVLVTGVAGTNLPIQREYIDSQQNLYETTAAVTLTAGATPVPVVALEGGAFGNLLAGAPLTLGSALSGVDAIATVDADGFSGGIDAETEDQTRVRLIARIQNPPSGSGTVADYVRWAKLVSGVTRAQAIGTARGAGTVDIYFAMDGRPVIVPLAADITAVTAAIAAEQPLTDIPGTLVHACTVQQVTYQIKAAATAVANQPAIVAALAQMHANLALGGGLARDSQIIPAIAGAAPMNGSFLIAPAVDIAPSPGVALTLGTVSFI